MMIIIITIIIIISKLVKDNFISFDLTCFIWLKQAIEGHSIHVHIYTIFFCKTDCKQKLLYQNENIIKQLS